MTNPKLYIPHTQNDTDKAALVNNLERAKVASPSAVADAIFIHRTRNDFDKWKAIQDWANGLVFGGGGIPHIITVFPGGGGDTTTIAGALAIANSEVSAGHQNFIFWMIGDTSEPAGNQDFSGLQVRIIGVNGGGGPGTTYGFNGDIVGTNVNLYLDNLHITCNNVNLTSGNLDCYDVTFNMSGSITVPSFRGTNVRTNNDLNVTSGSCVWMGGLCQANFTMSLGVVASAEGIQWNNTTFSVTRTCSLSGTITGGGMTLTATSVGTYCFSFTSFATAGTALTVANDDNCGVLACRGGGLVVNGNNNKILFSGGGGITNTGAGNTFP